MFPNEAHSNFMLNKFICPFMAIKLQCEAMVFL